MPVKEGSLYVNSRENQKIDSALSINKVFSYILEKYPLGCPVRSKHYNDNADTKGVVIGLYPTYTRILFHGTDGEFIECFNNVDLYSNKSLLKVGHNDQDE